MKNFTKGVTFYKSCLNTNAYFSTLSTYLKIQFLVQIRPDGRLPGVGLALAQHVLTEVFHGVCHFWELHPTVALEGGQSFSFAVSLPETAFGVDKPATNFDNRRSNTYSSLLLLSNRNLQEWPIGVVKFFKVPLWGRFSTDFDPKVTDLPSIFCLT